MRKRHQIEQDGSKKDLLILEVLLDIRDSINKALPAPKAKRGRPKKEKHGNTDKRKLDK